MMQDGEISRARAVQLAHMVLFDNAARLYGLARRDTQKTATSSPRMNADDADHRNLIGVYRR